jgi:hypothetical protein
MTREPHLLARVSADEAPDPPINEMFRSYTQSTAFSLSLGRTHIRAFMLIEQGLHLDHEYSRWPVNESAIGGLVRRGLIEIVGDDARRFDGDTPRMCSDVWRITDAGKIVMLLLAEAGLVPRSAKRLLPPPPPPGWTDPRPKLRVTPHGAHMEPSERERSQGGES